jgi:hypothetical protein
MLYYIVLSGLLWVFFLFCIQIYMLLTFVSPDVFRTYLSCFRCFYYFLLYIMAHKAYIISMNTTQYISTNRTHTKSFYTFRGYSITHHIKRNLYTVCADGINNLCFTSMIETVNYLSNLPIQF